MSTAHTSAQCEVSPDPVWNSGVVFERHPTVRAGPRPLQSHFSQSSASATPWAGGSWWLRVVPSEGGSSPVPRTEVGIWAERCTG